MSEPLEGFRDLENSIREQLGDEADQIEILKAGLELEQFEKSPAGQRLAQKQLDEINDALNVWLGSDDPRSEAVVAAHFRARVAVEVLNRLREVVTEGDEAKTVIESLRGN
jgi:phage gp37-like protein